MALMCAKRGPGARLQSNLGLDPRIVVILGHIFPRQIQSLITVTCSGACQRVSAQDFTSLYLCHFSNSVDSRSI